MFMAFSFLEFRQPRRFQFQSAPTIGAENFPMKGRIPFFQSASRDS